VVAAAKVPTVRTVEGLSTFQSVGNVAVADVPIPSKFCVYAVDVDKDIAAKTTATDIKASTEIKAVRIKKRERVAAWGLGLDIETVLSRY
jgi:hypothetical protein